MDALTDFTLIAMIALGFFMIWFENQCAEERERRKDTAQDL